MALINWDSNLSVNISEIDRQHQKLIIVINELHDAMKQGKSKEILGTIVEELIDYTKSHFKTEERYLDQFKYPESEFHKEEHASFVKKVSDIKNKIEKGRIYISVEIMNFLRDWLQDHIKVNDKKYAQFFINNGLK